MVEIRKIDKQKKGQEYPYIGISKEGQMVLFNGNNSGMLMFKGCATTHDIGYYNSIWDESAFEPFDGILELENKE